MATATDARLGVTRTLLIRRHSAPQRFVVMLVYAFGFSLLAGWPPALATVAAYTLLLALEFKLFDPKRDRGWRYPAVFGWALLFVNSCAFGAVAVAAVLMGGAAGLACGSLLLVGSLVYSAGTGQRSTACFVASSLPFAIGQVLLIALYYAQYGQPAVALGVAVVSGMAMFTCYLVWRINNRTQHDLRSARAEADRRRREAEALMDAKSAFVAMVSHELRTPISAILAGAEAIERDPASAETSEHAALIAQSGRMMRTLLNDLLDLSKMEAGRMTVEAIPLDLPALVRDTVGFWSAEADRKGLTLTVEGLERLPERVTGDPTRLSQVLNNLFSNALKFTPAGGVVLTLQAEPAAAGWRLVAVVRDTGPGMTEEQMARLFRPFDQTQESTARTHGGTGLGLAISRELARLMGGELTCASAPGQGATFTLEVALGPAAAEAASTPPAPTPALDRPARLLVVDDHEVNRRAIALMLQPLDVELVLAEDGDRALELAARTPFDVIVMDVNMPGIDGCEATRRIRAKPGPNQHAPIIACTGSGEPHELDRCRAAGMTGHVLKPIDAAALVGAIAAALEASADQDSASSAASR